MKKNILAILMVGLASRGGAGEFFFLPERFSSITIVTTKGKECVVVKTWAKEENSEAKIFESRLLRSGSGRYVTPNGTMFILEHLPQPVINDDNRRINSGDWRLSIAGNGAEFRHLKEQMPTVTFGDTPPLTYLGIKK